MPEPDVVLIIADQLNFRHLGCMGNAVSQTPNVDRLAAEGVVFENAYCQAPLCMPSRAAFNTGLYPHACRVRHNPVVLHKEFPTLAERLGDAGYRTGGFGHIGGDGIERGFITKMDLCDEPLRTAVIREQEHVLGNGGRPASYCETDPRPIEETPDGAIAAAALDFLTDTSGRFYMQVNFNRPHPPLIVPEPFPGRFDPAGISLPPTWRDDLHGKPSNVRATRTALGMENIAEEDLRRAVAQYEAAVSFIDHMVGRIVSRLTEAGQLDNTLVMFFADHGDYAGEFGIIGKTGQFYESLVHVPLIARCPGLALPAGRRVASLVSLVDLVPTVLDACGVPGDASLHGASRLALARGETDAGARAVFASTGGAERTTPCAFDEEWDPARLHPPKTSPYSSGPCCHVMDGVMVRRGKHKLTVYRDGSMELYDIEADPWERDNLASQPALRETICALSAELLRWQMETWPAETRQTPLAYHFRSSWPGILSPEQHEKLLEWERGAARSE